MISMTAYKEDAVRRKSWTQRGGRVGYFEGPEWEELEAGAKAAGFVVCRTVKKTGHVTEKINVVDYIMHLHRTNANT